jgi:hypothetical protein
MAIPRITDFVRYINRKLTGINWNNNLQKIINWFTDGTADVSFNTIQTTDDITVGGDLTATGNITANKFIGDGSEISNLNQWRKNFIINGGCLIKNNAEYTLVKDIYGTSVDRFDGMATGTIVETGILTQNTGSALCGTTGYSLLFNGVTITGPGIIYLRHRLYNKNAVNFKNKIGSFSCQVYHNVGVSVPYTIYINKANDLNNFTSVSAISNSGSIGVNSQIATQLKFENISLGDCTNGLEILIKIECGAIILKRFEFTELQLELNPTASEFEYRNMENDEALNFINTDGTLYIADNSITTPKILDKAVTTNKIADNSVWKVIYSTNSIPGYGYSIDWVIPTTGTKQFIIRGDGAIRFYNNSDLVDDIIRSHTTFSNNTIAAGATDTFAGPGNIGLNFISLITFELNLHTNIGKYTEFMIRTDLNTAWNMIGGCWGSNMSNINMLRIYGTYVIIEELMAYTN